MKIIKIHFTLLFSVLYLFIRSCKFVIIETRPYKIAHGKNVMSSLIIQSMCLGSSQTQPPVFYNKSYS